MPIYTDTNPDPSQRSKKAKPPGVPLGDPSTDTPLVSPRATPGNSGMDSDLTAPSTAFRAGQVARTAVGAGVTGLANAQGALGEVLTAPVRAAGNLAADFTRGAMGGDDGSPPLNTTTAASTTPSVPLRAPPRFNDVQAGGVSQPDVAAAQNSTAPGTAVINGRVLSAREISDAGNRINVVPAGAIGNPAPGVALSEASGGRYVPQFGDALTAPAGRPAAYDPAADIQDAQRDAQSDLTSIALKDPRSPLGVAARNLQVDRQTSGGGRGATATYQQGLDVLTGGVKAAASAATTAALQTQKEQGDTNRDNARNAVSMFDATQRRPAPHLIQLDDGTTHQLGADNILRPVLDAAGKPVKQQQKINNGAEGMYTKLFSAALAQNGGDVDAAREAALTGMAGFESRGQQEVTKTQHDGGDRPTATGKDGTKYRLSADGKSWEKQ